jgi:hypothetical protein
VCEGVKLRGVHKPLDPQVVKTIKEKLNLGIKCSQISREMSVSYSAVYNIREGVTYSEVHPLIKRGVAKTWVVHKEITNESAPNAEVIEKIPKGWGY